VEKLSGGGPTFEVPPVVNRRFFVGMGELQIFHHFPKKMGHTEMFSIPVMFNHQGKMCKNFVLTYGTS
jgi:hypothetical protein